MRWVQNPEMIEGAFKQFLILPTLEHGSGILRNGTMKVRGCNRGLFPLAKKW
jgi:hypothetical protein